MKPKDSPLHLVAHNVSEFAVYLAESELQLCTTDCGGS